MSEKNTITVNEWEHPLFDMKLILPADGSRGKPEDYFGEDEDADATRKIIATYEMTAEALDALPEWDD